MDISTLQGTRRADIISTLHGTRRADICKYIQFWRCTGQMAEPHIRPISGVGSQESVAAWRRQCLKGQHADRGPSSCAAAASLQCVNDVQYSGRMQGVLCADFRGHDMIPAAQARAQRVVGCRLQRGRGAKRGAASRGAAKRAAPGTPRRRGAMEAAAAAAVLMGGAGGDGPSHSHSAGPATGPKCARFTARFTACPVCMWGLVW